MEFREQIGTGLALPHIIGKIVKVWKVNVLVNEAGVGIGGYNVNFNIPLL